MISGLLTPGRPDLAPILQFQAVLMHGEVLGVTFTAPEEWHDLHETPSRHTVAALMREIEAGVDGVCRPANDR